MNYAVNIEIHHTLGLQALAAGIIIISLFAYVYITDNGLSVSTVINIFKQPLWSIKSTIDVEARPTLLMSLNTTPKVTFIKPSEVVYNP